MTLQSKTIKILSFNALVKISMLVSILSFTIPVAAQVNSTVNDAGSMKNKYLILRVTNDILDCPHFGMLISQVVEQKLHSSIVDKNPKEKYLIIHNLNTNYSEDAYKERFIYLLDSIQFPKASIKEIFISNENPNLSKQ